MPRVTAPLAGAMAAIRSMCRRVGGGRRTQQNMICDEIPRSSRCGVALNEITPKEHGYLNHQKSGFGVGTSRSMGTEEKSGLCM